MKLCPFYYVSYILCITFQYLISGKNWIFKTKNWKYNCTMYSASSKMKWSQKIKMTPPTHFLMSIFNTDHHSWSSAMGSTAPPGPQRLWLSARWNTGSSRRNVLMRRTCTRGVTSPPACPQWSLIRHPPFLIGYFPVTILFLISRLNRRASPSWKSGGADVVMLNRFQGDDHLYLSVIFNCNWFPQNYPITPHIFVFMKIDII